MNSVLFESRKSLLFLCLSVASVVIAPQYAEAAQISEDFDDPAYTTVDDSIFTNYAGVSAASLTTSNDCETFPKCLTRSSTGYNKGAEYDLPDVYEFQVLSSLWVDNKVNNSAKMTISDNVSMTLSNSGLIMTGNSMSSQTFATSTQVENETWYTVILEFRENPAGFLDVKPSMAEGVVVTSGDWASTTLSNLSDIYVDLVMTSNSASAQPMIDSFLYDDDPDNSEPFENTGQNTFSSENNTRFLDLVISGTSTVNIEVDYFLDEDEIDTSISARNPTLVRFQTSLRPSTTMSGQSESIDPLSFGTSTVDTNLSGLADGTYDLLISFSNLGVTFGSDVPFSQSYIYTDFTIAGGVLVATGTPEFYDATTFYEESRYSDCGLTNIGGCLQNVIIWLFVPSQFSTEYFETVKSELETKVPFAYIFAITNQIAIIQSGSGTLPSITLDAWGDFDSVTILDPTWFTSGNWASVFTTVKALSTMAIWGTFVLVLYRRSKYYLSSISNAE